MLSSKHDSFRKSGTPEFRAAALKQPCFQGSITFGTGVARDMLGKQGTTANSAPAIPARQPWHTDQSEHKILYSMQIQKQQQIIHTPAHFFDETGDACPLDFRPDNRRLIGGRVSASDSVLVERCNFHVCVADTHGRHKQVSALINRMYSWRGYRLDASESRRNPGQITLQACSGKETLGTLTLNVDSEEGLLADELYRREVDALRKRGRTVCELTGLAVESRLGSNELLATLFHLLHILGRRLHRATDAVIEINPRHSAYYQRVLGFRQIGEGKLCGRVDAPAVLLHIEGDFVEEQIARHAGYRKKTGHSLYPYFFNRLETERLSQRILEMRHLLPGSQPIHS